MEVEKNHKLYWIELLRGIAAFAVVVSHGAYVDVPKNLLSYTVPAGTIAVAFFFVLSGFIILHVHGDDIDYIDKSPSYLWRRIIRIFPTYWFAFAVYLALHLAVNNRAEIPQISWGWLLHELCLAPGGKLLLFVAWTLRHELLFYILFLSLIINRRLGAVIFSAWLSVIAYNYLEYGWTENLDRPASETATDAVNIFFFVGMLIATLSRNGMIDLNIWCPAKRFASWCGKISYPLYLIHPSIYFAFGGIARRLSIENLSWETNLLIVSIASLAAASLVATYFEKPILNYLRETSTRGMLSIISSASAHPVCLSKKRSPNSD